MIQFYGLDIANSMSEIVQGVSGFVLALCAVVGGVFGWGKWSDEKALKRSKMLDTLLEKFNNNELRKLVCTMHSSGGASEFIKNAMLKTGEDDRVKVEESLMFVAQLCQLKSSNVLSEDEFLFFKDSVMKILDDDDVKVYINKSVDDSDMDPECTHYAVLLRFASRNGIDMNVNRQNSSARKDPCLKDGKVETELTTSSVPIQEDEFDLPTAIIKINRKYRKGMNDDQILEAVAGWWRLRMDVAEKVRLVLAVANGCVIGVYRVERWISAKLPEEVGRIGFVGKTADAATCKRFIGRSTTALFSRGAANPVRYFNVKLP